MIKITEMSEIIIRSQYIKSGLLKGWTLTFIDIEGSDIDWESIAISTNL
jgi:hypothetical protein